MKNNREQISAIIPWAIKYGNGEKVQFLDEINGCWKDVECWNFETFIHVAEFRIKPEPKFRPWRPQEVPVGAWFRWPPSRQADQLPYLIIEVNATTVFFGSKYSCRIELMLTDGGSHSIDGGKTWQPCGILES